MPINKHYTCCFSHLILSGRCSCQFSAKDCIAEKEFGTCLNADASSECQSLYHHLKANSDFVLKSHHQSCLSVAQQSKIKMGGLLGLQAMLYQKNDAHIDDVFVLVAAVKNKYTDFKAINFSKLMPRIAQFKFRKKP